MGQYGPTDATGVAVTGIGQRRGRNSLIRVISGSFGWETMSPPRIWPEQGDSAAAIGRLVLLVFLPLLWLLLLGNDE